MGEKPKKAPEQTQMVKMGMLGKTQIVHYITQVDSPFIKNDYSSSSSS